MAAVSRASSTSPQPESRLCSMAQRSHASGLHAWGPSCREPGTIWGTGVQTRRQAVDLVRAASEHLGSAGA